MSTWWQGQRRTRGRINDTREVLHDRAGFDMVAHEDNEEAEGIGCGVKQKGVKFAEGQK